MSRQLGIGLVFVFAVGSSPLFGALPEDLIIGKRGDTNNDQAVDHSDIIYLANFLFSNGPQPPCMNQADVNDDSDLDNSDVMYLSNWLYQSGSPPPPAPGPDNPDCDPDLTTPNPGCDDYQCTPE